MAHGSDPRRRSDQQSPDSGASVPPAWWSALSEGRLPAEGPRVRQRFNSRGLMQRIAVRIAVPAVVLAVVATVVLRGFGYQIVAAAVGAAIALGLVVVTVVHHRKTPGSRTPAGGAEGAKGSLRSRWPRRLTFFDLATCRVGGGWLASPGVPSAGAARECGRAGGEASQSVGERDQRDQRRGGTSHRREQGKLRSIEDGEAALSEWYVSIQEGKC